MEDSFDARNRVNLRHFIGLNESKKQTSDETSSEGDYPVSYYYIHNPLEAPIGEKAIKERREIQRIPTCAIFHKLASGKGVPHTFVGKFAWS